MRSMNKGNNTRIEGNKNTYRIYISDIHRYILYKVHIYIGSGLQFKIKNKNQQNPVLAIVVLAWKQHLHRWKHLACDFFFRISKFFHEDRFIDKKKFPKISKPKSLPKLVLFYCCLLFLHNFKFLNCIRCKPLHILYDIILNLIFKTNSEQIIINRNMKPSSVKCAVSND